MQKSECTIRAMLKQVIDPRIPMSVSLSTARYKCPVEDCQWEYRECDGINSFDFGLIANETDAARIAKIIAVHLDKVSQRETGKHTLAHLSRPSAKRLVN